MTEQPTHRLAAAAAILIVYFIVGVVLLSSITNRAPSDATWN